MQKLGCLLLFCLCAASVLAAPELPRVTVDTTMPTQTGTTITVNAGGNLQQAINSAQPGDTIILEAGATFSGNFVLPAKSNPNNKWIIIKTSAENSLPPQGQRINPSYIQYMPILKSSTVDRALTVQPSASYYRLIGIAFTEQSSYMGGLLRNASSGSTVAVPLSYGIVTVGLTGAAQDTLAEVPHHIIFDRVYIYGSTLSHVKQGIALQSAHTAVIDSYISEIHGYGQDTQAIIGWNGPGPFLIRNNHLEGAGENLMFGGDLPSINNLVPEDIIIHGNYFYKPPQWSTQQYWSVKNSFELKFARRLLIENNIFENSWKDGQTGFGIVIKSSNPYGSCPWCVTEDVTFQNNIVRATGGGISISGREGDCKTNCSYNVSALTKTNDILLRNNLVYDIGLTYTGEGRAMQIIGVVMDSTFDHNTLVNISKATIYCGDLPELKYNLTFTNNLLEKGSYGFLCSGSLPAANIVGWIFTHNAFIKENNVNNYPTGNYFPATPAAAGITDYQNRIYSLLPTSMLAGKSTDGSDIGADFNAINIATRGVVTGVWSAGTCTDTTWLPTATGKCGTIMQTSNCGNTRTTAGSVTCSATETCTNNACVANTPLPKTGDLDGNGQVDIVDVLRISQDLGRTTCGLATDLNNDCQVNIFDFILAARNWG